MTPPRVLQIELSTYCNAACLFCGSAYQRSHPAHMAWEVFASILPLVTPGCEVSLFGNGEALLHPRALEALEVLHARGASTYTCTNGMPVQKLGASRLAAAGLNKIAFSITSVVPWFHALLQPGVDPVVVWQMVEACARAGITTCLAYDLMWRNLLDLPGLADRAAQAGVKTIFLQELMLPVGGIPWTESIRAVDKHWVTAQILAFEELCRGKGIGVERRFSQRQCLV